MFNFIVVRCMLFTVVSYIWWLWWSFWWTPHIHHIPASSSQPMSHTLHLEQQTHIATIAYSRYVAASPLDAYDPKLYLCKKNGWCKTGWNWQLPALLDMVSKESCESIGLKIAANGKLVGQVQYWHICSLSILTLHLQK